MITSCSISHFRHFHIHCGSFIRCNNISTFLLDLDGVVRIGVWPSYAISILELLLKLGRCCKIVEDLLEGCLGHWILANFESCLIVLDEAKHVANREVASVNLESPGVAPVFNDFDTLEFVGDHVNELFAIWLSKLPLEQLFSLDCNLLFIHLIKVDTDTIRAELTG